MARGRMISNSLSTSEKFARVGETPLGEFCHALYPLVVAHSDDFGRLQGDAFTVKAKCYPASFRTLAEFERAVQALHEVELVVWYVVDGKRYLQIVDFERHQTGLHKRTRSRYPRVPESSELFPEIPSQEKGTKENLTKEKRNKDKNIGDWFDRFWRAYPRKAGKDAALKAFEKRKPTEAMLAEMIAALEIQKRSPQWHKEGGIYIPHPATWLNQGRWQDEAAVDFESLTSGRYRSWTPQSCPHQPPCQTAHRCIQRQDIDAHKSRAAS